MSDITWKDFLKISGLSTFLLLFPLAEEILRHVNDLPPIALSLIFLVGDSWPLGDS